MFYFSHDQNNMNFFTIIKIILCKFTTIQNIFYLIKYEKIIFHLVVFQTQTINYSILLVCIAPHGSHNRATGLQHVISRKP